ncbi:hypothetical protein [Psychroflexus aestuariivivens]|uniref:hypothetical protein n=1 Tax=Psychroflexus aestuariivivens TaxID=1795040 RepID=UPI000FD73810|nr:hypothetical protein [Psychroflexus aestuariivivens]
MKNKTNISGKKSGFKIPEHYFKELEARILEQKSQDSETSNISSGFNVPKDYFENFNLELPYDSDEKQPRVIQLTPWLKWISAACIIGFGLFGTLYIDSISQPKNNLEFTDLDDDMIENYIDYNIENPEDFIDLNKNSNFDDLINKNIVNLKDQDILNYLDEHLEDNEFNED